MNAVQKKLFMWLREVNAMKYSQIVCARRMLLILGLFLCSACKSHAPANQISFVYYAGVPLGQMMQEAIPEFTRTTGIQVNYSELPYDAIRQREVLSISNNLGNYDVAFVDDIWLYEYARKGYLTPLDEYVHANADAVEMKDFFSSALKAEAELDGKIWLMPQRADVQVLFYRTDLFNKPENQQRFSARYHRNLAVPDTWDDYREVAEFFTDIFRSSVPRIYGSGETLKRPHFAFEFFAMRYWSYTGQQFFSDHGEPIFDSLEGVKALDSLVKLGPITAPGAANWSHDETISAFSQGQLAMAPQWYDFYPTLRNKKTSRVVDSLGVAQVPGVRLPDGSIRRTPSIGGGSLGIPRDARNKVAAWEFVKYMTGKDFLAKAALRGAIVPRKSAYRNPQVKELNPSVDIYLASLEKAWFRPRLVDFARIESIVGKAVSRAFVGESTSDASLRDAQAEIKSTSTSSQ